MDEYKNIVKVESQDDGSVNIVLRNGKRALIQIKEMDRKFRAEIYYLFGSLTGSEEGSLLTRLEQHEGFQECARDALGWVDANAELVEEPAETGESVELK